MYLLKMNDDTKELDPKVFDEANAAEENLLTRQTLLSGSYGSPWVSDYCTAKPGGRHSERQDLHCAEALHEDE